MVRAVLLRLSCLFWACQQMSVSWIQLIECVCVVSALRDDHVVPVSCADGATKRNGMGV